MRLRAGLRSVLLSVLVVACSGEGIEAPTVIAPDEDTAGCPSADSTLQGLKGELDAGAFDPLRPTIETVLVDGSGLKTQLTLLGLVLPELKGDEVKTILRVLTGEGGAATLAALKPHLINILEYIHGTSPFIAGKHAEPMAATHEILTSCDAAEQLLTLRNILALEVKRAPAGSAVAFDVAAPGTGDSSWLFAMLQAVDAAAKLPKMKELLENIEIEDDGSAPAGGAIRVGRDAFVILAKLLAANIAAPDFEIEPTRELLEDVLIPQLDGDAAAVASLDELLDLLSLLVAADSATFEGAQAFMGCVDRHDDEAAIPAMLFDYMTIDELPLEDLLDDAVSASAGEQNGELRIAIIAVLDAMLLHGAVVGDAVAVVAAFVDDDNADVTLDTVLSLKGTGVLNDLLDFVAVLIECKGVDL